MPRLDVRELTVEFPSAGYMVRPLDSFSFTAGSGELVLLLGPSGCGKTTLLSCLAGILAPRQGTITLDDLEVTRLRDRALTEYRRRTVGIVFQAFNLIPSLTAEENVAAPLRAAGVPARRAYTRSRELLASVRLEDRRGHRPGALSGGQQQRVAIARALAHDPPLVLADEPTAHLDHIQVEGVLRIVRELAAPGRLVIVATHDDRLHAIADRVIEMAPRLDAATRAPERVELRARRTLFEQGSRGELIYVVESGEIEIVRRRADGGEELLTVVRGGGYFGELGPMLGLPRSASARARTDAVLTGYTVKDFRQWRAAHLRPEDGPEQRPAAAAGAATRHRRRGPTRSRSARS